MATLLVANPDGEPRRINVPEDGETTIGRKSDNAIVISDSHLSSHHAILRFDPERQVFFVRDLGSHNGTRVNSERLGKDEIALKDNDSIVFGILEATLLPNRPVRSLAPKPLERPSAIEAPAAEIPIIDVETLRAATKKPAPSKNGKKETSETVPVEEVCRELIKRLDLMDDLLERYKDVKKDPDVVMDLEVLKQSFQDMLSQYQVEAYSFDPETEISMDMRKKIEIVKTVKSSKGTNGDRKNCIVQTLHEGYLLRQEGSKPVILRKAHVTTRTVLVH